MGSRFLSVCARNLAKPRKWAQYVETISAGFPLRSGGALSSGNSFREHLCASASRASEPASRRGGRRGSKTSGRASAWCAGRVHSSPGGRKKKMGMTLAGARGGKFSCVSASLPPLPVAAALRLSLLLAVGRVAIALLRLPRSPLTGCHAAGGAAITRQRPAGPEDLLAMLQQTPPTPRTTSTTLGREKLSEMLLFRRRRRILTGAHGSSLLPEAQVSKGNYRFPFEAPFLARAGARTSRYRRTHSG